MPVDMTLRRVWVAAMTWNCSDAGACGELVLKLEQALEPPAGTIVGTFAIPRDTDDLTQGTATLYDLAGDAVTRLTAGKGLSLSTVRAGRHSLTASIQGARDWRPQHVLVWGEFASPDGKPAVIESLGACFYHPKKTVIVPDTSTVPLRINPERPAADPPFNTFFIIVRTQAKDVAEPSILRLFGSTTGTDDDIRLTVGAKHGQVLNVAAPRGTQKYLSAGGVNMFTAPAVPPFRRGDLAGGAASLGIGGKDGWLPAAVFILGMAIDGENAVTAFFPIVHEPDWNHGWLSQDTVEGEPWVRLNVLS